MRRIKHFKVATALLAMGTVSLVITGFSAVSEDAPKQPPLGYRSAKLLTIDGLQFKDLNRNGKLDKYEDWRLPHDVRAKNLLSQMSVEDKAGFMLISSTRLENDWSFESPKTEGPITSGFNEVDLVQSINMFTHVPLPVPQLSAAGTTKGVKEYHLRHFILRANTGTRILAEWANNLQALCESDGLGIPAIIASNPRNHITRDASIGLSVGKTSFSTWPGELGMAAMRDSALVRQFADIARREWKAIGLRKGYMYMADLATEPRWQRVEGTFGEDAALAAQTIRQIVLGFQGEGGLSPQSVALTVKHFPGGGATENGQDPHFFWGKREVFPGNMFKNNLISFRAAIDAKVAAIMPYYSIPVGVGYEEVAYAYNKGVLRDLLRKQLGFDGIINSDTGPIDMMPWGVEDLSITERYKKSLEAGINIYSGTADPTELLNTIKSDRKLMKYVDDSVYRLLMEFFQLGLFENPYVDVEEAVATVGNKEFQAKADLAMRKSIVLLRNPENLLPLKPKTKVYFESYYQQQGTPNGTHVQLLNNQGWDIDFVDSPDKADVNLFWITPGSKSLFDSDGSPLLLSLSKNGVNTCYVNCVTSQKPTVLVVNYTNPWVIDEIYNESTPFIQAVLATFGTTPDALLDVVTGKFNPTGKMPFTTPVSEEAAQNQKSDVPGYLEGEDYPLFKFGEGLSYK